MSELECPDRDRISLYAAGRLPANAVEELEDHLARCEACSETFNRAADESDPLLSQLKIPVPTEQSAYLEEPAYQDAVSAAAQLKMSAIPEDDVGRVHTRDRRGANLIGRRFGQYELKELIGQGGMGMVYRARHVKLNRSVAFKVLPHTSHAQDQMVQRFEREMQAVGRLQHPNIVQAFDADEVAGIHFLAMEFVDGLDLSELLRRHGTLPVAEACEVVRQAAVALQHAFENGLVHRDVKPGNLMLDRSGTVKVLDLGLALLQNTPLTESAELTSTGQLMGTVDYMAPEQAENTHEVDIRADIYSLGATLYALLTGAAPFAGTEYLSNFRKLAALANDTPRPIRDRRPELPTELATIVDRMLARDPTSRFSTPAEIAAVLKPFAADADPISLLSISAPANGPVESSVETDPSLDQSTFSRTAAASKSLDGSVVPEQKYGKFSPGIRTAVVISIPLLAAVVFVLVRGRGNSLQENASDALTVRPQERLELPASRPVENSIAEPTGPADKQAADKQPVNEQTTSGPKHQEPSVPSRTEGLRNLLDKGAHVIVETDQSGRRRVIHTADDWPNETFHIVSIHLDAAAITDSDLKNLGSLPRLESLKVFSPGSEISSEGLRHIAGWSSLKILTLRSTGEFSEGALQEISKLRHLQELGLFPAGGVVTGEWLEGFGPDHPMEVLGLSPHLIVNDSGVERLSRFTNLKELTLTGKFVGGRSLRHLASLRKLEKLQIRETIEPDALRQLGKDLPWLSSLTVYVSARSLPSLQTFTNLNGLHIIADGVPDSALVPLQTMTNLGFCRIEGNLFTAAGIAALRKKLPDCTIVPPDGMGTTSP